MPKETGRKRRQRPDDDGELADPPGPVPFNVTPSADETSAQERPVLDAYRKLFERSADAILIIEGETFIDCNSATVKMLRYRNKDQLLKTHPSELSPPFQPDGRASHEKASEMIAIAFERGSHRFEWEHLRADGEAFPVEVLLTSVQEPDRRVLHVVWRDITKRKRLESELRHAQKMEAVGKLAGGIAHDFNNLLVALVGNADLLKFTIVGNADALKYTEQIELAAERASALVKQLLAFSRKQELVEQVIDINALIRRIQALLERLIGEDICLETALGLGPLCFFGDDGQIEQVLLNLASNARDAMPDGGTLAIQTSRVHADDLDRAGADLPASGEFILISISDSGTGMTGETLERAFDPFFTTKRMGKGTGLGLSTVYGIVRQAGGETTLDSADKQGTTAKVYLPLVTDKAAEPAVLKSSAAEVGGNETILLVEDEEAVSTPLEEALSRLGYKVILTRNGQEALDAYEARADEIDLILTDVIMPIMGGVQLFSTLRSAGHTPRVLFISGHTDSQLSALSELKTRVNLLRKPFRISDLTRSVRSILDR